jgi:hypothetical protein
MYGSIAGGPGHLSEEDRYFELYTKLRYYLKGIKAPGGFSPTQRAKLIGKPLDSESFLPIFPRGSGISGLAKGLFEAKPEVKAAGLFKRLRSAGILDDEGRVAQPEQLTQEQVGLALPREQTSLAPDVFRLLRRSIPSPHIQIGPSSDFANIAAWRAYLGESPAALGKLEDLMSHGIMELGEDPVTLSKKLWSELLAFVASQPKTSPASSSFAPAVPSVHLSAPVSSAPKKESKTELESKLPEKQKGSSVDVQDPSSFLQGEDQMRIWDGDSVGKIFRGVDGSDYKLLSYSNGTFRFKPV